jgi:hypothetical protein
MKHIVFFAMLATACAAFAQAKPEAPKAEAAKPESPKPAAAAAAAAKPQAKATAVAKKQHSSRRSEDARQCLERATNNDIIKCAEEYL